jgi:hypothetical protein
MQRPVFRLPSEEFDDRISMSSYEEAYSLGFCVPNQAYQLTTLFFYDV